MIPHSHFSSLVPVAAHFRTSGIRGDVIFNQKGSDVTADFILNIPSQSVRWQIHELPVDSSIDPKLRCRPEYVGQYLHSDIDGDYIYNVTATSLVFHSIVLLANDSTVACGTIHLESGHEIPTIAEFKSGVFGKLTIIEWPGE